METVEQNEALEIWARFQRRDGEGEGGKKWCRSPTRLALFWRPSKHLARREVWARRDLAVL